MEKELHGTCATENEFQAAELCLCVAGRELLESCHQSLFLRLGLAGAPRCSPRTERTQCSPHTENTGRNASPVQSGEGEGSEGAEGRELNPCCEEDPGPSTQRTSCFDKNTMSRGSRRRVLGKR